MSTPKSARTSVAPLVGAWIEIDISLLFDVRCIVAPLVGAWIEIVREGDYFKELRSLLL